MDEVYFLFCPDRWTQVNQDIADQLQRAQSLLQLWQACNSVSRGSCSKAGAAGRKEMPTDRKHQHIWEQPGRGLPPALQDAKVGLQGKPRTRDSLMDRAMTRE